MDFCRLQIAEQALRLMEAAAPLSSGDSRTFLERANQLSSHTEAPKLAIRLHLLSLLFEVPSYTMHYLGKAMNVLCHFTEFGLLKYLKKSLSLKIN